MRIAVLLDRARLFRWHLALIGALKAGGRDVLVRFRQTSDPLPNSLTLILDFDRARGHTSQERFSTHMDPDAFGPLMMPDGTASDITLDLSTGVSIERQAGPVIRPLYNGSVRDYALFQALLDRRPPQLAIWHSEWPQVLDIGRPAFDDALILSRAFDQSASRMIEGLVRLFSEGTTSFRQAPRPPQIPISPPSEPILQSALWYGLARVRRKLRRAADLFSGNGPRHYTAWRSISTAALPAGGALKLAAFRVVEDDGDRTLADPCIFSHDGVVHCFVTETAEASGIAAIGHLTLGTRGAGRVRTIVSTAEGIARPFVFSSDGQIWMLAQSGQHGVDLYRCRSLPGDWVLEKRLVGEALFAPTFFEAGGRLWISGASQAFQSSASDGLALYWSETVLGPWHAHARNPALVDGGSARPAGALWRDGEALMRPGADRITPGGGIAIKRISALSPDEFEEDGAGAIRFSSHRGLSGPSTVTRGGGFEVIGFSARPSAVRESFRGSAVS